MNKTVSLGTTAACGWHRVPPGASRSATPRPGGSARRPRGSVINMFITIIIIIIIIIVIIVMIIVITIVGITIIVHYYYLYVSLL